MESNNLVLGKIPCNGGSMCKTYEESMFIRIGVPEINVLYPFFENNYDTNNIHYLYYNYANGNIELLRKKDAEYDNYKQLEIINIFLHGSIYFIEIIDKEILHKHLLDERVLLERQLNNDEGKTL